MFKNIFVYIFVLMFSVCPLFSWQGGSGTETDPYQIWTKADMDALADTVNDRNNFAGWSNNKHFKLMADITEPITQVMGDPRKPSDAFRGHFDGNGKTITMGENYNSTYALFCSTDKTTVIENLNVTGSIPTKDYLQFAGIVLVNYGVVQNCNNYATIEVNPQNYGRISGIVGMNRVKDRSTRGKIINCVNYGNLEAESDGSGSINVAGIAATSSSYISNCVNVGNIKSSGEYSRIFAGGIVGERYNVFFDGDTLMQIIQYCTNIGKVESSKIAGGIYSSVTYSNSANNDLYAYLYKNINHGFVHGNTSAGGIVGECIPTESARVEYSNILSNCLNTGVVSGNNNVGCIIGSANSKITITDCYFDKQMCPYGGIGGK